MKVLAVGDIHTKLWVIDEVRKIADNYDKVVFVGDYADDWKSSPQDTIDTWKELRSLSHSNPNVKLVIGNHDYAYLLDFDPRSGGHNWVTQLMLNSVEEKGLKEWLSHVPITLDIDGVTYSHAGVSENWDNRDGLWQDESPIWVRPQGTQYKGFPQVFGHTPSATCWEVQPWIWCIDTFSTYRDGTLIGDQTVLEITDGKWFNKIKLENKNDNNTTNGIKS